MPESVTVLGLPALPVMVRVADRAPKAVGVNVTVIVLRPPGDTVSGRGADVAANSEAFGPVRLMPEMTTFVPP